MLLMKNEMKTEPYLTLYEYSPLIIVSLMVGLIPILYILYTLVMPQVTDSNNKKQKKMKRKGRGRKRRKSLRKT